MKCFTEHPAVEPNYIVQSTCNELCYLKLFTLSPKLIIFLWHVLAISHFSPFPFRVLKEDSGFKLQKILILIPILTLTLNIIIIIIILYQTYYRGTGLVDLTSPSGLAQEFCKLKRTSAQLTNQLYESPFFTSRAVALSYTNTDIALRSLHSKSLCSIFPSYRKQSHLATNASEVSSQK